MKEVIKNSRWDAAKRYAAMGAAIFVIACSVLSLVGCFLFAFALPLLLPNFVSAVCNLVLGCLMLCVQFNRFGATVSKYFGFLDTRVGRGVFYLFIGSSLLGSAMQSFNILHILSFVAFGCCWFVGFCELCGPASRHHVGDAMLDPASTPAGGASTHQPVSGGAADGSITINLTPAQMAAGANFVANNAESAWSAAVRANATGGGASSSGGGGAASSAAPANPFFGAK